MLNGDIYVPSIIMNNVMASATEEEFSALFVDAQDGTVVRTALEEMGHRIIIQRYAQVIRAHYPSKLSIAVSHTLQY